MATVDCDEPRARAKAPALPTKLLSRPEVARLFGVRSLTVGRWARLGHIPGPTVRVGDREYWSAESVARFLGAAPAAPAGPSPKAVG